MSIQIETSPCTDEAMIDVAVTAGKWLADRCMTAIVILTSECPVESHGIHTTCATLNSKGALEPSEARAAVRRLRSLADERGMSRQ